MSIKFHGCSAAHLPQCTLYRGFLAIASELSRHCNRDCMSHKADIYSLVLYRKSLLIPDPWYNLAAGLFGSTCPPIHLLNPYHCLLCPLSNPCGEVWPQLPAHSLSPHCGLCPTKRTLHMLLAPRGWLHRRWVELGQFTARICVSEKEQLLIHFVKWHYRHLMATYSNCSCSSFKAFGMDHHPLQDPV